MLCHLLGIACDQVVPARREKTFRIGPGRTQQRDSAGKRLENPDRGNSRQLLGIEPARHMDCREMPGEYFWHARVGQPAPIRGAVSAEAVDRFSRIAHPVDIEWHIRTTRWFEQEFL